MRGGGGGWGDSLLSKICIWDSDKRYACSEILLMNKVKKRDMMHYIPMHSVQEKKYESYLYYF